MKKCIVAILLIATIVGCKNNKTEIADATSYTINGTTKGIDSGEIYMQVLNKTEMKTDTVKIKNGKFSFTGKTENPQMVSMVLAPANGSIVVKNATFFFNEPSAKINVTIDTSAKQRFVFTGSKATDELNAFKEKYFTPIEEKEKTSFENVNPATLTKVAMDSLMKKYNAIQQEKKEAVLNYIKANKSSFVGAGFAYFVSMQEQETDSKFLENVYTAVDDKIKNSFYGIEFGKLLSATKNTNIGAVTPNFTANDSNGNPVILSHFYANKKLTLIDFWASWCGPCRKENPNVVAAYSQYHSKGFEIIGVSLDENKNDWTNAIKKDNLTWQQVSDLKGWESGVAKMYNVTGIPTNFLVNEKGIIVAKNLRGDELESKLKELLK